MALINETTESRSFVENDDERRRTLQWLVPYNEAENEAPELGDPYQTVDPPPAFEDTACKCIGVEIHRQRTSGTTADKQGIALMTATYSTKTPGTGQDHDIIREWDLSAATKIVKTDLSTPFKVIRGGSGMSVATPRAAYRYKRDQGAMDNDVIMDLTGTVNDNAFLGKPARTFLFLGARAVRKNSEYWSVTYEFQYSKLDIANKEYGHYAFWDPPNIVDPETGAITITLPEVYRVYRDGDFGRLGIGFG